eukprot:2739393-Rhodomonas_salina.1
MLEGGVSEEDAALSCSAAVHIDLALSAGHSWSCRRGASAWCALCVARKRPRIPGSTPPPPPTPTPTAPAPVAHPPHRQPRVHQLQRCNGSIASIHASAATNASTNATLKRPLCVCDTLAPPP